jgi:ribosome-binding factor A
MKPTQRTLTGPTQRQLRVGEQLRHAIADVMLQGHFHEPILLDKASLVTVTEVRISPDLKYATAYVMTLGGTDLEPVLAALNNETHVFQKEVARKANLRFTPKIRFVTDDSFAEADKIERLLRDLPKD